MVRLRLPIYPSPQILQIDRWFCHFTPASRLERNIHRFGPFPPDAFCCTSIDSTATRSATLAPAPALPTHGFSSRLRDEISSPGAEGFSSFHILLLTMSSLIPRRREPRRIGLVSIGSCCFRPLSTVSASGFSCNEATSTFTAHCNL